MMLPPKTGLAGEVVIAISGVAGATTRLIGVVVAREAKFESPL
jgi:hypothetical protein